MKMKLSTKQILSAKKLLNELKEFTDKRYGNVQNIFIAKHHMMPDTIIIKYEKTFILGGDYEYEYAIASINQQGEIEFLGDRFKDVFQRSAFLSECIPFDMQDENNYQLID